MMKQTHIWIWVHQRAGVIEEDITLGLAAEAGRILSELGGEGIITAIAMGDDFEEPLENLGQYRVNRVYHFKGSAAEPYHGEYYANVLADVMAAEKPFAFLMTHTDSTADLAPRLAALLNLGLVTRAIDLKPAGETGPIATRPIAGGHLSEELRFDGSPPYLVTFLPTVLSLPEPAGETAAQVIVKDLPAISSQDLDTEMVEIIEAAPEALGIEEADILVAGGRGVGKDEQFEIIHRLAAELGGAVAGTRPVVDWQTLAYDRQIGQTGKTVVPKLIINCGISGANEYTAGMEKSRNVVAINIDPRARIFRFADLGVVGNVHEILPLLINRLQELKR